MVMYDNVIISSSQAREVLEKFEVKLKSLWGRVYKQKSNSDTDNVDDYIFAKDERSLNFEYVPESNEERESYIHIIVVQKSKIDLNILVENDNNWNRMEGQPDSYSSRILLNDVYEYTLVTPSHPEEGGFSEKVYTLFIESLSK